MATKIKLETAGSVWKVMVSQGESVKKGDTLFIMEIMKMEVPHEAPVDGTVSAVHIEEGEQGLEEGALAMVID